MLNKPAGYCYYENLLLIVFNEIEIRKFVKLNGSTTIVFNCLLGLVWFGLTQAWWWGVNVLIVTQMKIVILLFVVAEEVHIEYVEITCVNVSLLLIVHVTQPLTVINLGVHQTLVLGAVYQTSVNVALLFLLVGHLKTNFKWRQNIN